MTVPALHWIVSYPKSGNTWVRLLLASLLSGGKPADFDSIGQVCPNSAALNWMESLLDIPVGDMTAAEQTRLRPETYRLLPQLASPPFWLKVHDRYDADLFPTEITSGIVYIVRDPRDVAPSWADHLDLSIDETIERMGRPNYTLSLADRDFRPQAPQCMGSWSENVRSWLEAPPRPLLLLRYEDMLANPRDAAGRLADFLGLKTDAHTIGSAVAACSFAALQTKEAVGGFKERREHQELFFRQGRAGTWPKTLRPDQAAKLWADHRPMMEKLGYGL